MTPRKYLAGAALSTTFGNETGPIAPLSAETVRLATNRVRRFVNGDPSEVLAMLGLDS